MLAVPFEGTWLLLLANAVLTVDALHGNEIGPKEPLPPNVMLIEHAVVDSNRQP